MPLEPLIVLLAEAQALRWLATYRAGSARLVLFDVATPTDARQVPRRVVLVVSILVVNVRRLRLSTTLARPRRHQFSGVIVRCRPACPRRRPGVERLPHALLIAELPAIEMDEVFQVPIGQTLSLQQRPAVLAVLDRGRFLVRWHG